MRRSTWIRILLFGFVLLFSASSFASPKRTLKIGASVSYEGKYRAPSFMIYNALKIWQEQVNRRGGLLGHPVKLMLYDDKSRKALVRKNYEKMIKDEKVDFTFSPYGTPLTLVASEVTEKNRFIMLAAAASGEKIWSRGYRYVFGLYAPAQRYFIGLLDLLARNGFESLSIIHENTAFTRSAAEGAEVWAKRFGMSVVSKEEFADAKQQMPAILQKTMKTNPDALIVCAYPDEGHEWLRLMKETGYRPKAIGMTIAPVLSDFPARAGEMAEGVFAPSQWEPDERIPFPGTIDFIHDFKQATGKLPSYHAGSAYSACQILERAVNATQSLDQKKIRDFISTLDTVGVIGRFKVDNTGKQIGHNPLIIQWQGKKKEIVYPTNMQTAPPRF